MTTPPKDLETRRVEALERIARALLVIGLVMSFAAGWFTNEAETIADAIKALPHG